MTKLEACQRFKKEVLPFLDPQERSELTQTYKETHALLKRVLPRGRFVMDEDGSCIAVARGKRHGSGHVFAQSATVAGIYWSESPHSRVLYLSGLGPLVTWEANCGDEGLIHFKADEKAADALPWFSKGRQRGSRPRLMQRKAV